MSTPACVVYADLVSWSLQNLADQISSTQELSTQFMERITTYNLQPLWKTSTGDGFAVAFERKDAVRVAVACIDLLDRYLVNATLQVRLALGAGDIASFHSPLTGTEDFTGPGIIKARRVLDGITGGNVLLLQKDLADDIRAQIVAVFKPRFVQYPDIQDKHGGAHHVCQILSDRGTDKLSARVIPTSLSQLSSVAKAPEIVALETALGTSLLSLDGLVLLWMDGNAKGREATSLIVQPEMKLTAESLASLPEIPKHIKNYAAKHRQEVEEKYKPPNNPKFWVQSFTSPLVDRPRLCISLGRTDYFTSRALEAALDDGPLRQAYHKRKLDLVKHQPGTLGTHSVIVTSDRRLILAQRKPKDVAYAGGAYSISCEEQCDPRCDKTPTDTVLRGLSEEFNLDAKHGVYVGVGDLSLHALASEWNKFLCSVLIYRIDLPATAEKVFECWNSLPPPKDKNEHIALAAVPLDSAVALTFLRKLASRSASIVRSDLQEICGSNGITGDASDGDLHPTSGRARLLIALHAEQLLS